MTLLFDADDTLWHNERFFRESEQAFYALLSDLRSEEELAKLLFECEVGNLPLYGYGVKPFVLSMMEVLQSICPTEHPQLGYYMGQVLHIGRRQLEKPVELLPHVAETLLALYQAGYEMIIVTKGDLIDQDRKAKQSGLTQYFSYVEVVGDKQEANYQCLMKKYRLSPEDTLMVGNSLKSDIIPILNLGARAVYIPYEVTWAHEHVEHEPTSPLYTKLASISNLPNYIIQLEQEVLKGTSKRKA